MDAVKHGFIGRLPKEGRKPEVFYDLDHYHGAVERQKREAEYVTSVVSSVLASPAQVRAGIEAMGGDALEQALSEKVAKS